MEYTLEEIKDYINRALEWSEKDSFELIEHFKQDTSIELNLDNIHAYCFGRLRGVLDEVLFQLNHFNYDCDEEEGEEDDED